MLTPERAIEIQCLLGADIQMQLDECIELPAERKEAERAMELSLRWAERARVAFAERAAPGQALFGIVQGGVDAGSAPPLGGSAGRHGLPRLRASAASPSARARS